MADVLKFIIALAACIALMLVIRTYGFALYTIPDDSLKPMLAKGQRVLVNKLSRSQLKQGDAVVFGTGDEKMAGRIVAVSGDTVDVDGEQYLIPTRCQIDYDCDYCRLYLIATGRRQVLVPAGTVVGTVFRWGKDQQKE